MKEISRTSALTLVIMSIVVSSAFGAPIVTRGVMSKTPPAAAAPPPPPATVAAPAPVRPPPPPAQPPGRTPPSAPLITRQLVSTGATFYAGFAVTAPGVIHADLVPASKEINVAQGGITGVGNAVAPVDVYFKNEITGQTSAQIRLQIPGGRLTYNVSPADLKTGAVVYSLIVASTSKRPYNINLTFPKTDEARLDSYLMSLPQQSRAALQNALAQPKTAPPPPQRTNANANDMPPPNATGINAFPTFFNPAAVGRSDNNAYLLAYLSTAIYPDHLPTIAKAVSGKTVDPVQLHTSIPFFEKEFADATRHLFWNPSMSVSDKNRKPNFKFISKPNINGYDPEAMVIDTPQAVFVVFRGTDRVGNAQVDSFAYKWNEWLTTDFDLVKIIPGENLRGEVHRGFWNSLHTISREIISELTTAGAGRGGSGKPVWITGHSLGAGQAQLLGAWLLRKHNFSVQGVYGFAAPHVGDRIFVDDLNQAFYPQRLQRFEFVNDTVTMMPPYAAGYERAGIRNYFDDLSNYRFAKEERWFTEDALVFPTLVGTVGNAVEICDEKCIKESVKQNKKIHINVLGSDLCYHFPTWYLLAAYNQLPANIKKPSLLPSPLNPPKPTDEACSPFNVARGTFNNPAYLANATAQGIATTAGQAADEAAKAAKAAADATAKAAAAAAKAAADAAAKAAADAAKTAQDIIKGLNYTVNVIADNANGRAIPEGRYVFRANRGGRTLQYMSPPDNGSPLALMSKRDGAAEQVWDVKRNGLVGYTIKSSAVKQTRNWLGQIETKALFLDNPMGLAEATEGGRLQLWEANLPGENHTGNQQWSFIKVAPNAYVIRSNSVAGHVISVVEGDTARDGGRIVHSSASANNPLQVWIAEPAR